MPDECPSPLFRRQREWKKAFAAFPWEGLPPEEVQLGVMMLLRAWLPYGAVWLCEVS